MEIFHLLSHIVRPEKHLIWPIQLGNHRVNIEFRPEDRPVLAIINHSGPLARQGLAVVVHLIETPILGLGLQIYLTYCPVNSTMDDKLQRRIKGLLKSHGSKPGLPRAPFPTESVESCPRPHM